MSTKAEVTKVMAVMSLAYPAREIQEGAIEVYFQILQDVPANVLDTAAKALIATNTFYPSAAELRNKSFEIMAGASKIPTAAEAWEEVLYHMKREGSYKYPEFSHPLVEKAVKTFGWKFLCQSESVEFDRTQFIKTYDSLYKRYMDDAKTLPDVRNLENQYVLEAGNKIKQLAAKLEAK